MDIDWSDPEEYAYLKGVVDGSTWAWEFLRRNPVYQEIYQKSLKLPTLSDLNKNQDSKEMFRHFDCDPPSKNAKTYREYIDEAMATGRCSLSAKKDEILDQFGLMSWDSVQPPNSRIPPEFYVIYPEIFPVPKHGLSTGMVRLNIFVAKDDVVAAFSPHENIPLQIEKVREKLKEIKGVKRDGLPSRQTLYFGLRALDAKTQGVPMEEASKEIFRVSKSQADIDVDIVELTKKLKRTLSQAQNLMTDDYRYLVGKTLIGSSIYSQNRS